LSARTDSTIDSYGDPLLNIPPWLPTLTILIITISSSEDRLSINDLSDKEIKEGKRKTPVALSTTKTSQNTTNFTSTRWTNHGKASSQDRQDPVPTAQTAKTMRMRITPVAVSSAYAARL